MSNSRRSIIIVTVALVVAIIALLTVSKNAISERIFFSTGRALEEKLKPELRGKYGQDLQYTLKTFWKFYERGLLSKNDLNDVMDKMKLLRSREEISDREIFDFIGYVSKLYTDAMNRARSEASAE